MGRFTNKESFGRFSAVQKTRFIKAKRF